MLGLRRNAELPELLVEVVHELGYLWLQYAEVVILHLLSLRCRSADQGTSGEHEVLTLGVEVLIDQEVLLLRADSGVDAGNLLLAEDVQQLRCGVTQGLHGAKQRGLLIEGLAGVRTECGRDVEGAVLDEGWGARVPCGVAAGLEGGTEAAAREGGGIRLSLDELLSGELHDHAAVLGRGDEAVMLLCGQAGHRLEPVCEVGRAELQCPLLHRRCDGIRHVQLQMGSVLDGLVHCLVDVLRQSLAHDLVVKYKASVKLRNRCSTHNFLLLKKIYGGL